MKKIAAIIFILSANIILLAHAVIPHHHHHEESFAKSVCAQFEEGSHHHSAPDHAHQRDRDTDDPFNILDQEIIMRFSQGRQYFDNDAPENETISFIDAYTVQRNYAPPLFFPVIVSDASIPLRKGSYLSYIINSSGLRAPPLV